MQVRSPKGRAIGPAGGQFRNRSLALRLARSVEGMANVPIGAFGRYPAAL